MKKNLGPKVILFDIESAPNYSQFIKHFPQLSDYPGLTLKASINSIICFGYMRLEDKKPSCINVWDFKSGKKNINNDKDLCRAIREVLKDADCIITHNGSRFDLKFIQTRLLHHGLPPLPHIVHIDTCRVAKGKLLMFNNRLNTIAKFLTDDHKLENGGWDLWVKVLEKKKKAMDLMEKYCKQDVLVLKKVFERLKPLISSMPNYSLFLKKDHLLCPRCGSYKVKGHGRHATLTSIVKRFICRACLGTFLVKPKGGTKAV